VLYVDGIEAHNGSVQANISFCNGGGGEKVRRRRLGERGFNAVERFEELGDGFDVCLFGAWNGLGYSQQTM
jgi:hypothetical protein